LSLVQGPTQPDTRLIHPHNNGKQERNMNTEMKNEMHSATRELIVDELEVVSGGAGIIPVKNVFNDLFFYPWIKVVEKD
jgi:hypothetical protein